MNDSKQAGFRKLENAQWFIDYVQERLYLCRRTVWKGEWEQVFIA